MGEGGIISLVSMSSARASHSRPSVQVAFNIGGPALNQLANITDKREGGAKGVRKAFGVKKRK